MRLLVVYVNLTSSCNLRCSYCFEGSSTYATKTTMIPQVFDFINDILKSPAFKAFDGLELRLSGGEPTLAATTLIQFLRLYAYDPVVFTIKTNGYSIPSALRDELVARRDETLFGRAKIELHVSYNGREAHDLTRPSAGGKTTSSSVRETLDWCVRERVPFYIIPSFTSETLTNLFEAYKELDGYAEAPSLVERSCYPLFNLLEGGALSDDTKRDLVQNLKRIAAFILREKSWGRKPLNFDWFNVNAINGCGAGGSTFAIDTDGSVYPCYLCAYDSESDSHKLGTIASLDLTSMLAAGQKYVEMQKKPLQGPCGSCNVSFCVRCPAARFKTSLKTTYEERWRDNSSSPAACDISKLVDLVARAYRRLDGQ